MCNIIAVVYPAYISIKAIESPDKKDDTKWLTYWVVFACFTIVEHFSALIVQIIPFYWLIKCIFYIWCFAPITNNGSVFIYYRVIRPYFLKYEKGKYSIIVWDKHLTNPDAFFLVEADDMLGKAMGGARKVVENVIKKD